MFCSFPWFLQVSSCVSIVYISLFAFTSISNVLAPYKNYTQRGDKTQQLQVDPEHNLMLHKLYLIIQGIIYFKEWRDGERLHIRMKRKLEYLSSSSSSRRCKS